MVDEGGSRNVWGEIRMKGSHIRGIMYVRYSRVQVLSTFLSRCHTCVVGFQLICLRSGGLGLSESVFVL